MDALAYLAKPKRQPVFALVGDEDFLKRRCRDAIVAAVLGDADPSFAVSTVPGPATDWTTVRNDLDTLPFLAPARIVFVEDADKFVTAHRASLEKYAAAPSTVGVLVLDVTAFPDTTKLAKALPDAAKLVCKSPPEYKADEWAAGFAANWAVGRYGKRLSADAAGELVDRVGPGLGLIDQELAKLATAVGPKPHIEPADVQKLVGRSRAANVFRILDHVGAGRPADALRVLADLFTEGEDPLAILGPMTYTLRLLANVNRHVAAGLSRGPAMDAAGVPKWPQKRQEIDRLINHLGRRRLDKLTDWLVEVNLGLKGGDPLPPRVQLERLVARLARPRDPG
jgi:DNA polymerase-3 subunit delta